MNRSITLTTKYHGPTNTRGSRIQVNANSYADIKSKTYSYDYAANDPHEAAALKFADDFLNGARPVSYDSTKTGYIYIFNWIYPTK